MNDNEVFECSVCLEEYDWGRMKDKDLCIYCYNKLPPDALHPTKRTQIDMCSCGKRWNQWCAFNALNTKSYVICPNRLAACKTAEERRALFSDKTALILVVGEEHKLIKK